MLDVVFAVLEKTALIAPGDATDARLDELSRDGFSAVALLVVPELVTRVAEKSGEEWVPVGLDSHGASRELFVHTEVTMGRRTTRICVAFRDGLRAAAERVRAHHLELDWWFEVAREPALADLFPDLVASLQGHPAWRRRFPEAPEDDATHVIKCWPWLPATSREGLVLHEAWICGALRELPKADLVFLNDLQGGPSACGCGNVQCRWISDYGEKRSSTPAGETAAAELVRAVRRAGPEVVPIWTTECESPDVTPDGHCAGVPCFDGACWREMWKQLDPVAQESPRLGVLLLSRTFERSGPDDRAGAAWIEPAIAALAAADDRRAGPPIPASRLLAVLEAAGRSPEIVAVELAAAERSGVRGVVVSFTELDQSFSPRAVPDSR